MSGRLTLLAQRLYGQRLVILLIVHVTLIVLANQAAFWLRFDGDVPATQRPYDTTLLPLLIAVRLAVFIPLRLHQGVWRYASIWDLRRILIAVSGSSALFWAITHGVLGITVYPRSVFIIDTLLLILLMGGVRMARRVYDLSGTRVTAKRVLIFGAGDAGESIVRDMLLNARFDAHPIGFIDDDAGKKGLRIHGIPVLGTRGDVPEVVKANRPDELLIAMPSASPRDIRTIVRVFEPYKIRITTLPRLHDLTGDVDVSQIRQLQVEDLLPRAPVDLDERPVREFLEGRRILVTGAGGSIGSELCRQIQKANPATLILLDRHENGIFQIHQELAAKPHSATLLPLVVDITDEQAIQRAFANLQPHVVFHAAAHKHVPLMQQNPCEAVKNNIRGTRIVAEAAMRERSERFVLISTDKAVNPVSVMGATKRVAEHIVSRMNGQGRTQFTAVRFGNVLGSNGSVVPTFMSQIASGGPVTVTHPEMRRFFMLIPEAVQLVLHAGALPNHMPLLVLDMGEPVRVVDLARDLIRLSGYVPEQDIQITFTGERPGEKLVEELVGRNETAAPSNVAKIFSVRGEQRIDEDAATSAVLALERAAIEGRAADTERALRSLLTLLTEGAATEADCYEPLGSSALS